MAKTRHIDGFPIFDISQETVTKLAAIEETRLLNQKFDRMQIVIKQCQNSIWELLKTSHEQAAVIKKLKKKIESKKKRKVKKQG